jgi:hypothetical protein
MISTLVRATGLHFSCAGTPSLTPRGFKPIQSGLFPLHGTGATMRFKSTVFPHEQRNDPHEPLLARRNEAMMPNAAPICVSRSHGMSCWMPLERAVVWQPSRAPRN